MGYATEDAYGGKTFLRTCYQYSISQPVELNRAARVADDLPEFGTDEDKCYRFLPLKGKAFRFYIKAAHDCHLAFTTDAKETTPMLEVFIGAWNGKVSAVRFNKADDLIKVGTSGILSEDEYREFWVTLNDQQVRVGKAHELEAFMECDIPKAFAVTHVGYSTGWGARGWWKFPRVDSDIPAMGTDRVKAYRFLPLKGRALRFFVKAQHGCHLAFTMAGKVSNPMFEVIIGGWRGTSSAITINRSNMVVKASTPGIVDSSEFREFWITFDSGHIRVGNGQMWNAFMECQMPNQFKVSHFGYSTAEGAVGWWKFYNSKFIRTPDSLSYQFEPLYGKSLAFTVSSPYNCRLAFTSGPSETLPMIEVFIGSWRNQYSAIRLNNDKDQTVVKVSTPGIVSNSEKRDFWVDFHGKNIRVGRGTSPHPFMSYANNIPWKVTHFGFCNGNGSTGEWNFYV